MIPVRQSRGKARRSLPVNRLPGSVSFAMRIHRQDQARRGKADRPQPVDVEPAAAAREQDGEAVVAAVAAGLEQPPEQARELPMVLITATMPRRQSDLQAADAAAPLS